MQKGLSLFWRGAAAHCLRALAVLQAACCNHWRCISSIPDLSGSLRATPVGSATLKLLTLATQTQEASNGKNMQKTWKDCCVVEGTFQNANCVHKNWRCEVFSSSTPTDSWQMLASWPELGLTMMFLSSKMNLKWSLHYVGTFEQTWPQVGSRWILGLVVRASLMLGPTKLYTESIPNQTILHSNICEINRRGLIGHGFPY